MRWIFNCVFCVGCAILANCLVIFLNGGIIMVFIAWPLGYWIATRLPQWPWPKEDRIATHTMTSLFYFPTLILSIALYWHLHISGVLK